MNRQFAIATIVLVALGCQPLDEAKAPAGKADAAREPSPDATPREDPPAARADTPAAPATPDAGPRFHLAVQLSPADRSTELYEIPALRMFETLDGSLFVTGGPVVLRVEGDRIPEPTPEALRGIKPLTEETGENMLYGYFGWRTAYLGGRWPDGLFLTLSWNSGFRMAADPYELHRWRDDRWVFIDTLTSNLSYHITRAAPWVDEQILGLRRYSLYLPEADEENYDELAAKLERQVERARKLVVLRGEGQAPKALSTRAMIDFDATADGALIALLGGRAALKYDAASDAITDQTLPGTADTNYDHVELIDARHGWAWTGSGPATLAFYDGSGWRTEQAPACGEDSHGSAQGLASFAVSPAGRQWAACGEAPGPGSIEVATDNLWTRLPGEPWAAVALPEGAVGINQIIIRGEDDVWLASDRAVYHSKRPAKIVTMPSLERMWLDALAYRDPVTAAGECGWYTALLKAELDGDYADEATALRKILTGVDLEYVELGEGEFRGRKRLVLSFGVGDETREIAVALRERGDALVEDIYCFYPEDFEGKSVTAN